MVTKIRSDIFLDDKASQTIKEADFCVLVIFFSPLYSFCILFDGTLLFWLLNIASTMNNLFIKVVKNEIVEPTKLDRMVHYGTK